MNNKRGRTRQNPDLRTPQEKAEWEEIRAGSVEMQRRARLPEAPKPFDLWSYDTAHLLDELAGIREIILRVPITLQTKSALQSAIDRIWRVEEDVRFLLSLQRDMQASFARKGAQLLGETNDVTLKQAEQTPSCTPIQGLQPNRGTSNREIG